MKNIRPFKYFENVDSINISKDIIMDIYQDLLDTIEWEYDIAYKIYAEDLVGVCIFDKRLYNNEELRNSNDKFETIFNQCKNLGWVSSSGMVGRVFPDKESKVVFECSDRMVNHLGFIKPLIEVELFDRSRYNADRYRSNLCGYQFFFTNKKWEPEKKFESVTTSEMILSNHPKFQSDYPDSGAFIQRSNQGTHELEEYFSEIVDEDPKFKVIVTPSFKNNMYMIEFAGKIINEIPMDRLLGSMNRMCEMENLSILSVFFGKGKWNSSRRFFFVVGKDKINESYQDITKHPKFGVEYDSDNYLLIENHRFHEYLLEVVDQDPSLDIKIFKRGKRYLVQFYGHNVIKNTHPFVEGSNVPIIYGSVNRLCEIENLSIESIDYIQGSNKSSILFLLQEDKISESITHPSEEDIQDYFIDFIDKFDCTLTTHKDDLDRYEVCIIMDERYWRKHLHDVSADLHSCILHMIEATGLERNGSHNSFERVNGRMMRVIKKRFKGMDSKDLIKMRYLKKFENVNSGEELLDIFSELELDLPVTVEYYTPKNIFNDFNYQSICIIPHSKMDIDELMKRIGPIIEKAENFGYKKVYGRTLPWCLIEATEETDHGMKDFISTKSNQETDDIANWRKWGWRRQFKPTMFGYVEKSADDPKSPIITEINIYFEIS